MDPLEVDRFAADGLLNELERRAARRIISQVPKVRRIVADGERLFSALSHEYPHLEARNLGESVHVAVAAASIVAKDQRDRLFGEIAARYSEEFGEIRGGGYINAATADFLRRYHERYHKLPPETRRSWGWKLLNELEPRPLPLFDDLAD
jgi:ribonuclease HII